MDRPHFPTRRVLRFKTTDLENGDQNIEVWDGQKWILALLVRDSYLLQQLRKPPSTCKGLYAAVHLPKGIRLGRYVGRFLEGQEEIDASESDALFAMSVPDCPMVDGRLPLQSNEEQQRMFGRVVIDEQKYDWPGMNAVYINDPKGARGRTPNTCFTAGGFVHTLRPIPAFKDGKSVEENRRSELLINYGVDYHSCWL